MNISELLAFFDPASFAWKNLLREDVWEQRTQADVAFTQQFNVTVVGTPIYRMRWRLLGKQCFFQALIDSSTTLATVAGTSYMVLPVIANALSAGGQVTMTNTVTRVAVGVGFIDPTLSRAYPPTQAAIADQLELSGWYEV
jgi:hypothetical protein